MQLIVVQRTKNRDGNEIACSAKRLEIVVEKGSKIVVKILS